MKHPVKSDFDTAVTEAGVNVTFKPTNSIYSFYRLAESEDVARLGSVSLERVRLAGLVGIERGVVSGVINLESSDVGASDRRPRHDEQYHEL